MPTDDPGGHLQRAVGDEYAIVRLLGRGGMGAVYLARELALQRLVAVKVLPPDASGDAARRDRFQREAQLAAQLTHPNIVPLHRFGEKAGVPYYVMGFVRGESLAARLRRDGRLDGEEARVLLAQLADALEYAHGRGVVHRDIKPDNILIDDESGRPLLADFGIAQRTGERAGDRAGRIEGTLHYMSPGQAAGAAPPDARDDIYSLGVVGYVMLSGETPFAADTFPAFVAQQAASEPPPLASRAADVPSDLAAAVTRAIARDPAQRWRDARAFKDALGIALENDPDRLPGELREVAGSAFYSIAGGWIALNVAATVFGPRIGRSLQWVAAVALAVAFLVTAAIHKRKGFSWRELGGVALWPPAWWPFWWPGAWRRPWDLWPRLPRDVRRLRLGYSAVAIGFIIAAPLALRAGSSRLLIVSGVAYLLVTALMLATAWWAYRQGIPNNADLRSLILRSTADHRFWKRPQMLQRLLPVETMRRPAVPSTPAACLKQMADTTQQTTGRAREAGLEALAVARTACSAIADLDAELLAGTAPAEAGTRAAKAEQRDRLAQAVQELCRDHAHLAHDQTDDALRAVWSQTARVSASLGGHHARDAADSPTVGATSASADLTRAG